MSLIACPWTRLWGVFTEGVGWRVRGCTETSSAHTWRWREPEEQQLLQGGAQRAPGFGFLEPSSLPTGHRQHAWGSFRKP